MGVDVAQKELVVSLGRMNEDLSHEVYAKRVFQNKESGFAALVKWVKKQASCEIVIRYVMEATGVYHQKFAYYLEENGHELSIVMPNKISNYMRSLDTKTITDLTCADAITRFGLERKLDRWSRPKAIYRNLQQLTRERDQIVDERVAVKNQLHAEQSEAMPNPSSINRLKARIRFLSKQEQEIKKDIDSCAAKDESVQEEINILTTIPGVGNLTAAIVLAETNGFELIRNRKQLTSYAGLDVKEKQSGTSIKFKPKISKKGNRSLRKAMHMPALVAVRHNQQYKSTYARLVSKNGIKMKGLVAIQRKILELMYTLLKSKTTYQSDYEEKKRASITSN